MMEDQIISSRHQGSPSPHQQVSDEFMIPRDRTQIASTATNPRFVTIIIRLFPGILCQLIPPPVGPSSRFPKPNLITP